MIKVEIYTSPLCGFCYSAASLLKGKGVAYDELDIVFDPNRRSEMIKRSNGRHTVPQIFINDMHIGGCDELYALEAQGKLDPLLSAEATL